MLKKVDKTIGILRKLQNTLPTSSLLIIYKSFIRPHLDYGDIIYDQLYNASLQKKLESIQYNAAVAITGAIRETSKEKLFEELGLDSLQHRQWYRKLCYFHIDSYIHISFYFVLLITFDIYPIWSYLRIRWCAENLSWGSWCLERF